MRNMERETAFADGVQPFRNAVAALAQAAQGVLDDFRAVEECLLTLTEEPPLMRFSPLSPLSGYPFPQVDAGSLRNSPGRQVQPGWEGPAGNTRRPVSTPEVRTPSGRTGPPPAPETGGSPQGNASPARAPVFSLRRDANRRDSGVSLGPAGQHHPAASGEASGATPRRTRGRAESGSVQGSSEPPESRSPSGTRRTPELGQHAEQSPPRAGFDRAGQPASETSPRHSNVADGPSATGLGMGQPFSLLNALADSVLERRPSGPGSTTQQTEGDGSGPLHFVSSPVQESPSRPARASDNYFPGSAALPGDAPTNREAGALARSRTFPGPTHQTQPPVSALSLIDSLVEQLWSAPQPPAPTQSRSVTQGEAMTSPEGRLPAFDDFPGLSAGGPASAAQYHYLNGEWPPGATLSGLERLRDGLGNEGEDRALPLDLDTIISTLTDLLVEEARRHGVDLS